MGQAEGLSNAVNGFKIICAPLSNHSPTFMQGQIIAFLLTMLLHQDEPP